MGHPTGYDREYDADDHAAFFAPLFSEAGVMAGPDADACKLRVRDGNVLQIHPGTVYIKGRMALFDGTETVTAPGDCKIVARMNKSADVRSFQLLAVEALTQGEDIYDLELASAALTPVVGGFETTLTDTRTFLGFMGQPAYYPSDSDSLPYVLWLYTLGFPMTQEQRAMVEANPSLMELFGNSVGAVRAHSVSFTQADWSGGRLTIPKASHRRQSGRFGHALRHRLADGSLCTNTWAVMGTVVTYDDETEAIVLESEDAYDGQIAFFA